VIPGALAWLDALEHEAAVAALARCCGARRWAEAVARGRPYADEAALYEAADRAWAAMDRADILEALAHHPRIGADLDSLRDRFAATASWSAGEQAGVADAGDDVLVALRDGNLRYEERFGHIFIVCATGKSAAEMLALLEERLGNDPERELAIAAAEQAKITRLRLEKLEPTT
jgi:2-oxo-4-hydroxy-4-carboxy-5-ureidoimidazoline decarboxylase